MNGALDMRALYTSEMKWVVGIDEVGRGPLAGPVTVCALVIPEGLTFGEGPFDSKKLSPRKREQIFKRIKELKKQGKLNYKLASVSHTVIDRKGIGYAVRKAISRALERLRIPDPKCHILLDGGLRAPKEYKNQRTIIKGDSLVPIIGLASIVAKVCRDQKMRNLGAKLPSWGFEKHKGYGTRAHYMAIKKHGLSPVHRRSFLTRVKF